MIQTFVVDLGATKSRMRNWLRFALPLSFLRGAKLQKDRKSCGSLSFPEKVNCNKSSSQGVAWPVPEDIPIPLMASNLLVACFWGMLRLAPKADLIIWALGSGKNRAFAFFAFSQKTQWSQNCRDRRRRSFRKNICVQGDTVDGRNPAPPGMYKSV